MRPEERSPRQVELDQAWLAQFRFCPECCAKPCQCPRLDLDEDLLLDERFWEIGPDDEPLELEEDHPW